MMWRRWFCCVCVAGLLLCSVGCVTTGGGGGVVGVPALRSLKKLSGKPFDLMRVVRNHRATLLVWWATKCPCVKRYQARIERLQRDFGPRGVAVLAVASNADDTPLGLWRHAQAQGFRLPIVFDPDGELARSLGVISTPTSVLLDSSGRVRFFGWIDNERKPGEPGRISYARNALKALLAGRRVATPRAPFYGCPITRGLSKRAQVVFVGQVTSRAAITSGQDMKHRPLASKKKCQCNGTSQ